MAKQNKPLISIIIPHYNLGQYLEAAIKSALNQTYQPTEIIVVDDGSNDSESVSALIKLKNKYQDKIKFYQQANAGVASARNLGIKHSKGKLICCLDADDILDQNYLKKCQQVFQESNDPDLGIVTTYAKFFGEKRTIWQVADYDSLEIVKSNQLHYASLYKREVWENVCGYSENLRGYEDWDFWIKANSIGYKWHTVKDPLFHYRIRKNSKVNTSNKNRKLLKSLIAKNNYHFLAQNLPLLIQSYDTNIFSSPPLDHSDSDFTPVHLDKRHFINLHHRLHPKDIKIAILLGSPDISGGTYVIFKHALALQQYGYQITIITEHPFDINRLNWFPQAKQLRFISLKDAASQLYDLCLATWWKTVFFLPQIQTRKSAYFVQSIESKFCQPSERQLKEIIDFTYQLPFYFLTEAHWIQRYLQEIHHQSALLALNGIDKTVFKPSGETVDRSRPLGPRILVEGALGVFFKQTEAAIDVANKSGCRDIWLLTPTKIDKFPGTTRTFSQIPFAKVSSIMRSCDLILKLSKVEGMFGPPLEMMHCGGTAVTFDVTGYDEYLKDGINSLVYPMDNFAAVIDGLSKLLKDPSYLSILKNNALNTAKKWPDWSISSSQFIKNIQTILDDTSLQPTISINQAISSAVGISGPAYSALFHPLTIKETARLLVDKIAKKTTGLFLGQKSLATHYDYKHYPLKFTSEKI